MKFFHLEIFKGYMHNHFPVQFLLLILIHLGQTNPFLWGNQRENTVNAKKKKNQTKKRWFFLYRAFSEILESHWQCSQVSIRSNLNTKCILSVQPNQVYIFCKYSSSFCTKGLILFISGQNLVESVSPKWCSSIQFKFLNRIYFSEYHKGNLDKRMFKKIILP